MKKGDLVRAVVLSVDPEKKRVALGLKQLNQDPWQTEIPRKFSVGDLISGVVTKITNFGVFVEIEDNLEGLLHISELGVGRKVHNPEEVVKVGDQIKVRILKVDPDERKIGLSLIEIEKSAPPSETPAPVVEGVDDNSGAEGGDEDEMLEP